MYSFAFAVIAGACVFACVFLFAIATLLERIAEALEKDGKIK